jgi:methylmalonyl-CoA/ethylmalonyl-CoA epimerase
MLSLSEKSEFDHPTSILYYKVAELHPTYEALTANGVKFEQKPTLVASMPDHDLWMAFFRDFENNPLAPMAEVQKSNVTRKHPVVPGFGAAINHIRFHP